MTDHPYQFSSTLEAELNNALNFYNNNCKLKIDTYVEHDAAALGLMELGLLVTLGKELYKIWSDKQAKIKEMSGKYFEERFVTKYRLKKWDHY